ncbi:TIGR02444 family protein [Pseudomonas sp. NPDC077186]|uniref:TIGR02444 family protein n=1 Tax=Pseudomonas sp. NPDC077186 TaxID=3364421 RepID=UPI0037C903B5
MQDLWNFAVRLYARPGVEDACLQLQEGGGDVCLLLAGAWLQRRGVPCREPYLKALQALAEPWQREVVAPLRQLRRDWRTTAAADAELATLRERIKTLELEAERLLLQRIETLAQNWPSEDGEDDWLSRLAGDDSAALQVLRGAADS